MNELVARHRGLMWLTAREVLRVTKLWTQTIAAPVVASFLFIAVFGLSLGGRIKHVQGIDYKELLGAFEAGGVVNVADDAPSADYLRVLNDVPALRSAVAPMLAAALVRAAKEVRLN